MIEYCRRKNPYVLGSLKASGLPARVRIMKGRGRGQVLMESVLFWCKDFLENAKKGYYTDTNKV